MCLHYILSTQEKFNFIFFAYWKNIQITDSQSLSCRHRNMHSVFSLVHVLFWISPFLSTHPLTCSHFPHLICSHPASSPVFHFLISRRSLTSPFLWQVIPDVMLLSCFLFLFFRTGPCWSAPACEALSINESPKPSCLSLCLCIWAQFCISWVVTHPAVLPLSFLYLLIAWHKNHPHQPRLVCLSLSHCDQKPPAWKNDKPFHPRVCVTL